MHKTVYLQANKSPTHANLLRFLKIMGWKESACEAKALVNESWLQFSPLISETLEFKHLLADFLKTNQLAHLMPETYFIDDRTWPAVLSTLEYQGPWILKPSMLNNGQHIHLFPDLNAIEAHFLSPYRMGGPQVLQRYIIKPQLIQGPTAGHKFSIRQLMVLSTHAGAALFPNGYLNIALKPYQEDLFDQHAIHLTNEHLDDVRINVIQRLSSEIALFQIYKEEIINTCRLLVQALQKHFANEWQSTQPRLACFGVDFMVEEQNQKLWLLEVNHGPCFPIEGEHPLFYSLYQPFWQQLITQFIDRQTSDFILLS
jgi:tubulin--tyrosine ligase